MRPQQPVVVFDVDLAQLEADAAVALGGGVAANSLLRARTAEVCDRRGVVLKLVARELCTDNAAMIGSAARFLESAPYPEYLSWDASSG